VQLRIAVYMIASVAIGMIAREYARSFAATRIGDNTPRLWGRLSLDPRSWFDPFGSGLLPGLIFVLWAFSTYLPPPFAFAKPAPVNPDYWRRRFRDAWVISVAGSLANLGLAVVASVSLRLVSSGDLADAISTFMIANLSLCVFHLMPLPGLDGARIVGLYLPPRPREVYRSLDQYLGLFCLVVFFIFANPLLSIVSSLTRSLCRVVGGGC